MKIKLVSWDIDGTLYSLPELRLRLMWKLISRGRGRELSEMRALHKWLDGQRSINHSRVDPEAWLKWQNVFDREVEVISEVLSRMSPRAEVTRRIAEYKAQGVIQVTLSDLDAGDKLGALGLESAFEKSFSCREIGFWKPSVIPFERVRAEFGVAPEEHLHLGDRDETDGDGARASGCRFELIK